MTEQRQQRKEQESKGEKSESSRNDRLLQLDDTVVRGAAADEGLRVREHEHAAGGSERQYFVSVTVRQRFLHRVPAVDGVRSAGRQLARRQRALQLLSLLPASRVGLRQIRLYVEGGRHKGLGVGGKALGGPAEAEGIADAVLEPARGVTIC